MSARLRRRDQKDKFIESEFLMDPDRWPRWPILPLVSRTDQHSHKACGFVHASNPLKLYFGIMYRIHETAPEAKTWAEALARHESHKFDSADQLLDEYRID